MKILFICSSLEPGKDGVGDYTRKLAAALIKKNNEVIIAGINDRYQSQDIWKGYQLADNTKLNTIRFSSSSSWNEKIKAFNMLVNEFKPELISLQYVPYGYNIKGLPFYFPSVLSQIKGDFKWHVMFHEMWVGISPVSPFMHKLYGYLQKKIAISIIKKIKPSLIHTSNLIYQLVQKKWGISSQILPLFSNIPYIPCSNNLKSKILNEINVNEEKNNWVLIGIFGHLYEANNINTIINNELIKTEAAHKKLAVISFGKINPAELNILNELQKKFETLTIKILGEKSEEDISCIMQILDKGLSCTSFELIGKSGAFAAMKRHNLNVLVPKIITIPKYENEIVDYNNYLNKKPPPEWDVESISAIFINDIENIYAQP